MKKILTACPFCGQLFGVKVMAGHRPNCPSNVVGNRLRHPALLHAKSLREWLEANRDNLQSRLDFNKRVEGECWLWTAGHQVSGRGIVCGKIGGRERQVLAYRISAWIHRGAEVWDPALLICHHCDEPACFNPDHLFAGTQFDNMADAQSKGRMKGVALLKGEQEWSARLRNSDIPEIRKMLMTGLTTTHVARAFSVDVAIIQNIKARRTWRHVA